MFACPQKQTAGYIIWMPALCQKRKKELNLWYNFQHMTREVRSVQCKGKLDAIDAADFTGADGPSSGFLDLHR
jgi:hypothetical protein